MAGLALVSVTVILLGEDRVWGLAGVRMGAPETISLLVLIGGIGMGMLFPAVNNACIELMPDRVATIVGLRGMFRVVGGALGISLVTLILHGSATPATGFRAAFTAFGIELLCAIPLVFLMPDGRADKRAQTADVSAGHGERPTKPTGRGPQKSDWEWRRAFRRATIDLYTKKRGG
jgi:MFS family permease